MDPQRAGPRLPIAGPGKRPGRHPEHPTAEEGCRPASRGCALALMTWRRTSRRPAACVHRQDRPSRSLRRPGGYAAREAATTDASPGADLAGRHTPSVAGIRIEESPSAARNGRFFDSGREAGEVGPLGMLAGVTRVARVPEVTFPYRSEHGDTSALHFCAPQRVTRRLRPPLRRARRASGSPQARRPQHVQGPVRRPPAAAARRARHVDGRLPPRWWGRATRRHLGP